MTATLSRPSEGGALWGTMPGWGIVADLTPPELSASRQLKVVKKLIGLGLVLVIALCAGGYVYEFFQHSSASDALDAASARTSELTASQAKYANVTRIESLTQATNAQIATVMADDVDAARLLGELRVALPGTMSLTSVNLSLSGGGADATGAPSLDTSGRPSIGTVTIAGNAEHIADVATYVTVLSALPGIVNVVPSSNTAGNAGGSQWSITMQVTDALYTHRYNVKPAGSN